MNRKQGIVLLAGGTISIAFAAFLPFSKRYLWVYYSPYSSLGVDTNKAGLALIVLATAGVAIFLRNK